MTPRKVLATILASTVLSAGGLAATGGTAHAEQKQQTTGIEALCGQVEARLHVLLTQSLRVRDLKRQAQIQREIGQLETYFRDNCREHRRVNDRDDNAGAPTRSVVPASCSTGRWS